MNIFSWANLAFALLAVTAGFAVLGGVFHTRLSRASTLRFLMLSLLASLAGLMPLARHISPIQIVCMVSTYCSAAAVVAWLKFGLMGRSRRVFAFSITAVLYFDFIFVFTWIFGNPPLFTVPLAQPVPFLQWLQIVFAAGFAVLCALAVKRCGSGPIAVPALGKFTH